MQEFREAAQEYIEVIAWIHADDDRHEADFPSLGTYEQWLVESAVAIGLSYDGGPMPWTEIQAWAAGTCGTLTAFEFLTVRKLSEYYLTSLASFKANAGLIPDYMPQHRIDAMNEAYAKQRIASLMNKNDDKNDNEE